MSAHSGRSDAGKSERLNGSGIENREDPGLKGRAEQLSAADVNSEELDLLRLAVEGDRQAFGAFFRNKRARIFRLAARICGPAEADDVVQVVFLRLWKVLPAIKDLRKVNAWLKRTTVNRAIDVLRHIGRKLRIVVNEKEQGLQKMYVEPMHRGELTQVFNRAAERIGERQRLAFILREMEGFSSDETADIMAISGSTVRNLVMQARKGLQMALRDLFPEYVPNVKSTQEEATDER